VAGFLGTVVITLTMYFVSPWMTGGPMDMAETLGSYMGQSWTAGLIAHFVIGTLVLPWLYASFLFERLSGAPAVRGMTWGLFLWLMSQAAFMPVMGGGFFSSESGGAMAVGGSLAGHLLYGLILGSLAGVERPAFAHRAPVLEHRVRRAG